MENQNDKYREALRLRIRKAIARGPSQAKIAELCGVTDQAVHGWLTTGRINKKTLPRLAEITGVDPLWLLTGTGQESIDSADSPASNIHWLTARSRGNRVPLLTWDQAISGRKGTAAGGVLEFVHTDGQVGPRGYAITVNDDTNEPDLPLSSRAIIDPDITPQPNDYVFVLFADGSATIKQLVKDGGADYLRPSNPRYPIKPLPADATVMGVVTEVSRRFR